jgi:dCTP deaminase
MVFRAEPQLGDSRFPREDDTRAFWDEPRRADRASSPSGRAIHLCHTDEVVGGTNGFTAVCAPAPWPFVPVGLQMCWVGDVGYIARWTMEITNHSHATVVLPVGLRVAQILFFEVGPTRRQYAGKYGQQAAHGQDWTPLDMLPKLYNDRDVVSGRLARANGAGHAGTKG